MNTVASEQITGGVKTMADVERSLRRYGRDLDVSLEHIILASLQMVARDYDAARQSVVIAAQPGHDRSALHLS